MIQSAQNQWPRLSSTWKERQIGEPRNAVTYPEKEGLLIDRDQQTGQVVGATVLDYEQNFRKLIDLSWIMALKLQRDLTNFLIDRSSPT